MPTFQFQATETAGKLTTGVICAANRMEAIQVVLQKNLAPVSILEVAPKANWRRRVPRSILANVYRGMADLIESGMPLLKALEISSNQVRHTALRQAINEVHGEVSNGSTLAAAMANQPHCFDELSISMISVGEEAGFLEKSLQRIATLTERSEEIRTRLINAMTYPAFLLILGAVVGMGMFMFFVPIFEPIFERMRERDELPMATTLLLATSNKLRTLLVPLLCSATTLVVAVQLWLQSPSGAHAFDRLRVSAFAVGPIIKDLLLARYLQILGTLLGNGVPLLRSLEMAERSLQNRYLCSLLKETRDRVASGTSLVDALSTENCRSEEILESMAIGEQSNRLDTTLVSLSERLERRTQRKLDQFAKMLEPLLMTLLAVTIGFMIIALLMPIFTTSGRLV